MVDLNVKFENVLVNHIITEIMAFGCECKPSNTHTDTYTQTETVEI